MLEKLINRWQAERTAKVDARGRLRCHFCGGRTFLNGNRLKCSVCGAGNYIPEAVNRGHS